MSLSQFIRFHLWFSLRPMRHHPVRVLVVILGIALGAAVFTSVRLSVQASVTSFSRGVDGVAGRSQLVVSQPGGPLDETLAAALLKDPAVAQASVMVSTYVRVAGEHQGDDIGGAPFLLIGVDPLLDLALRSWSVQPAPAGREAPDSTTVPWTDLIRKPFTLLAGAALAGQHQLRAGGPVTLEHTRGTAAFTVLGTLADEGLALLEGGRVAITDVATFQEFTGYLGQVDRIDLVFKPSLADAEVTDIRERLTRHLPRGVRLTPPSERKASGKAMIQAYELNLSILSFASLFVGMFLVYSLVALNAASRRHELAVLRALGTSGGMLFLLFLAEGLLLGLLGWLLALPLSGVLITFLLQGVSETVSTLFVRVNVTELAPNPWELLLSLGVTLLVAMLAALQPALEARRISPREALATTRGQGGNPATASRLAWTALLLIALAWPTSRIPDISGVPLAAYVACLLLFTGFAMLSPRILYWLGSGLAPWVKRRVSIPAWLASHYIHASGLRTAISVGALITAVALFTGLVIMIHSFRQTVSLWVHQSISGDLFVAEKLAPINDFRDPMAPAMVAALKSFQDEVDLLPNRRFSLTHNGFPYHLDLMDLETFFRHGDFIWVSGNSEATRTAWLRGDGVAVSEVFANRTGLGIGDIYQAHVETTPIRLPILGIVRDYRTSGGFVIYPLAPFQQRYFDPGWGGVRLFFKVPPNQPEAALARLRQRLVTCCGDRIEMVDGGQLRSEVLRIFDQTFAVTTVLLLIALGIAALGITTTLSVMVLERSWQFNTLDAVGAGFGQIRGIIFWEAVLLVLAGEAMGLVCGFSLSWLLVHVINVQSFGWSFLYAVDWTSVALSLPLIMGTALVAAIPAMQLVFRKPPATLLRER